ncbi:hypothetical protein D9M72_355770 [compost metagenome]
MDIAAFGFAARLGQRCVEAPIVVLVISQQINHWLATEAIRRPLDGALGRRMNVAGEDDSIELEIRHRLEGCELEM